MTRTIRRITGVKYTTALRWRLAHGREIERTQVELKLGLDDAVEWVLEQRGVWAG